MKTTLTLTIVICFVLPVMSFGNTTMVTDPDAGNKLVIYTDRGKDRIAPEIYGHFAEHLGRCIYDGF